MTIPILATIVRAVWILIEYPYLRRYKVTATRNWDKHSATLWDAANAIELVGMVFGFTSIGHITTGSIFISSLGLMLLLVGMIIRGSAIYSLGFLFTGTVLIREDHCLVRNGLYKYLRHPAYTGALLAHLGLGLSFSNVISITLSLVPFVVAAFYRMHVEEQALTEAFGQEYVSYSQSTKRLIPKVY